MKPSGPGLLFVGSFLIFSDHSAMRLEINYREKNVKNTNTWRLNNTLLNNQEITEEIKEEIKKYLEGLPWWLSG